MLGLDDFTSGWGVACRHTYIAIYRMPEQHMHFEELMLSIWQTETK